MDDFELMFSGELKREWNIPETGKNRKCPKVLLITLSIFSFVQEGLLVRDLWLLLKLPKFNIKCEDESVIPSWKL